MALTLDVRQTRRQKAQESAYFSKVRNAETSYATALRKVARQVAEFVRAMDPTADISNLSELTRILQQYADLLGPWANATATRMIAEVSRRDEQAWIRMSEKLGYNLRQELRNAPLGAQVRQILADQVNLIKSLPLEAAERVQSLALQNVGSGARYDNIVKMILSTGEVTVNRATLIARTEIAKAQSALTQARAEFVGSDTYVWRTVRDRDVRPAHKRLEGKIFKWSDPPIIGENGERGLPGTIYNCRCYAEPILPALIQ